MIRNRLYILYDVIRRITEGEGLSRAGSKIQGVVGAAVEAAYSKQIIKIQDDFIWHLEMETPTVRDRSQLSQGGKKIDRISPEELAAALILQLESNFSMNKDEVLSETGRCLGFLRVTAPFRELIEKQLNRLVRSGAVASENGLYRLVISPKIS